MIEPSRGNELPIGHGHLMAPSESTVYHFVPVPQNKIMPRPIHKLLQSLYHNVFTLYPESSWHDIYETKRTEPVMRK
jgi:hypothetical protein